MHYDYGLHKDFYESMKVLVRKKKIKGLIIGYPLDKEGRGTPMCKFIESMIEFIVENKVYTMPITFIDENRTTKEAAIKILNQQRDRGIDKYFLQSAADSMVQKGEAFGNFLSSELLYKKTVYDMLAAQTILERFLVMYNKNQSIV